MEFKMPDIGEGVAEGEVVKWLVKEGDAVVEDQPLVEAATDKATVVIPCPTSGVVQKIFVPEGSMAKVGQVLISFSDKGAAPVKATPVPEQPPAPPPAPRPEPPRAGSAPRPEPARARAEAGQNGKSTAPPQPSAPGGKVLAAPATRKMAREAGVDLSRVQGSGPLGRVTRDDLVAFLERGPRPETEVSGWQIAPQMSEPSTGQIREELTRQTVEQGDGPAPKPRPSFPEGPRPETRVPMRGIRKKIAENMRRSKDHAAHFTFVEECDMTELVKLREEFEGVAKKRDVKLTYLPFIVKAVVAGLKEFPYLNSTYDEAAQEIVLKGYYNIGIAAATDEGLVVPVVKDCDRKSILEIGGEIGHLAEAARNRQLRLEDLQGGTFTITSLGAMGGIMATPVINYPEVGILGVHKIRKRPVVKDDEIVVRDMGYLTCSFDHRIIDGHIGAQFVIRIVQLLEDPRLLMLGA
jgi:pyruvate dehydrogenase E2 component (dihydrolipoamide acetyltransferase)